MKLVAHVFRRGAVYTWRRRIPLSCSASQKGSYIQVSLKTNDPKFAQRIGGILHGESERVFELMSSSNLSQIDAKAWLEHVVRDELKRIERRRLVELDDQTTNAFEDNFLKDELAAHAYRLLADKGAGATFDPKVDVRLAAREFPEAALENGSYLLDLFRRDYWSDSRHERTKAMCNDILGQAEMGSLQYLQLRRLMLKGKAIAYTASLPRNDESFEAEVAATVNEIVRDQENSPTLFDPQISMDNLPPIAHSAASPADVASVNVYSSQISDIVGRLTDRKRREDTDEKTLRQLAQVLSLFQEITEIEDITKLRQHHLAKYVDTLANLPKSYRKSSKDREKHIHQILVEAVSLPSEKKGLADNTIIRNLTFVSMVLKKAKSEGHLNGYEFDVSDLKPRRRKRARDERHAFTGAEVQDIFKNPLWIGCYGKNRRREPGDKILKDGRYWVPLIAAMTGARREEIAGLSAQDVVEVEGVWCFHIRENENRRLKNLQSERFVPVHSQLIELGLLEYSDRRKKLKSDLFPELKPASALTSYGDQIDSLFRKIAQQQITDQPQKTFHSFRHYVTDILNNSPDVKQSYRDDLLGHLGDNIGSTRYGSGTNVLNLKEVVERIPRIEILT